MKKIHLPDGGIGWVREDTDPPVDDTGAALMAAAQAGQLDAIVQAVIADLQTVQDEVKAAPAGSFTLARAQVLKIVHAVLWHIEGGKAA